jgi:hypothetical protein
MRTKGNEKTNLFVAQKVLIFTNKTEGQIDRLLSAGLDLRLRRVIE